MSEDSFKTIVSNRKAFHDYHISDRMEAGIALVGTEVKALRAAKCNLGDGWVDFESGEAILREVHIGQYKHGNRMNHDEFRPRRLLLHKREIRKFAEKCAAKGFTAVPLRMYFKNSNIKVEIALAKGKKSYDQRETKKEQEAKRTIARAMKRGR